MNRRQFTLRTLFLLLTAVGIAVGFFAHRWNAAREAARLANAYRLLDSEIAGTEVYFRDKYLGKTPLALSREDCVTLGLPASPVTVIDADGWGEGISFHDPSLTTNPRVMFKVRANLAADYLSYETPWGSRTKTAGGWELPNGFRSKFMSRGNWGGLSLQIDFSNKPDPADKVLKVRVTAANNGTAVYSGFRPRVDVHWGTLDARWASRAHKGFWMPAEWAHLAPGQSLRTTAEIPLPATSGDYSVFATSNLFRNNTDDYLVAPGSVYSDSKLLHIP